jgi:hypothetical protein
MASTLGNIFTEHEQSILQLPPLITPSGFSAGKIAWNGCTRVLTMLAMLDMSD